MASTSKQKSFEIGSFKPHPLSYRWNTGVNIDAACCHGDRTSSSHSASGGTSSGIIGLTTADMDFPRSEGMEAVIHNFAKEGCLIYPTEHPEIAETTLARIHKNYGGTGIKEEDVIFFPSVIIAINALLQALQPEGTPYTLLVPNYPPLRHLMSAARSGLGHSEGLLEVPLLDPCHIDEERRGRIDFDRLGEAMKQAGSKVLLFSNPSNPLGRVWRPEEIAKLKEFTQTLGVHLISDEIWIDWTFDRKATSVVSLLSDADTTSEASITATVMATSKTFNLGGLNCAYITTKHPALRTKLNEYRQYSCGPSSPLAQVMLLHLYREGDSVFRNYQSIVGANRDTLVSFCAQKMPQVKPLLGGATHVAWLDAHALVAELPGNPNPATFFLEKADVDIFPGDFFGKDFESCLRINLATEPQILQTALSRMEAAISTVA